MTWNDLSKLLSTSERKKLACESSSPDILSILAQDPNFNIREEVVTNDFTSLETLELLAKDYNVYIREYAKKRLSLYKKCTNFIASNC